jgi:Lrp/AsnC family transcriptional regulator for asnA, asnC and gidA
VSRAPSTRTAPPRRAAALRRARPARRAPPRPLDDTDRRIVVALSRDGRRPYRDIARELGISEGTVRVRMTRLLDQGLLRVTVVGSPLALGIEVVAVVLINVKPGQVDATARALGACRNVRFVGLSFGAADIIIQTLHPSVDDLHEFMTARLPALAPAITRTETFQLAAVRKSSWTWEEWF